VFGRVSVDVWLHLCGAESRHCAGGAPQSRVVEVRIATFGPAGVQSGGGLAVPSLTNIVVSMTLAVYGDRLGPSIEWLRARGKTWDDIIDSATNPGPRYYFDVCSIEDGSSKGGLRPKRCNHSSASPE
jgi:hypothetical protein